MNNWLDKFENGGEFLGTTNRGFDYNGAWNGQWQNGGKITIFPTDQNFEQRNREALKKAHEIWDDRNPSFWNKGLRGESPKEVRESQQRELERAKKEYPNYRTFDEVKSSPEWMVYKLLDPTGISSYPDVAEEWGNGNFNANDILEPIAALPFVGKLGKFAALMKGIGETNSIKKDLDSLKRDNGGELQRTGAPSEGKHGKKTIPSAQKGMQFFQQGLDFKPKTISKNGSEIKTDPNGYYNPHNWGKPVIIPSNIITMEGVKQPLMGISDVGDVQYMQPDQNYVFKGNNVVEVPMAYYGVNLEDEKTAQHLHQLTNFTNKATNGWLQKYS